MVMYRRVRVAGATYFFTVALADRRQRWLTDHIDDLRSAFQSVREQRPFEIDAIVVLPDHLHSLWTLPPDDTGFAARWQSIKLRFTCALQRSGVALPRFANGDLALWQRRYWEHLIRDEGDWQRHRDYIHFNPVKHGLVRRVADWPYSSFHAYGRRGELGADWGGDAEDSSGMFGEPK